MGKENSREETQEAHKNIAFELLAPFRGHFIVFHPANFAVIANHPTGPRLRKHYRRVNLKVFPFYLAYVVEGDLIWVLAVAHGSRRPGYWMNRM